MASTPFHVARAQYASLSHRRPDDDPQLIAARQLMRKSSLCSPSRLHWTRVAGGSTVDAVEPQIRELLRAYPRMPATVIAERVGWGHGGGREGTIRQ